MTAKATMAEQGHDPYPCEGESGLYWRVIRVPTDAGIARMEVLIFRHHEPHRPYKWAWAAYAVTPWDNPDAIPVLAEWRGGTWRLDGADYPADPRAIYRDVAEAALNV
jgi:hypothetical protein